MRRSFDGLSALVKTRLQEDPLSGHLFVFLNRRRTLMKVLYYDRGGYCVWSKRLEQGRFHGYELGPGKVPMDMTRLQLMVAGIDLKKARQLKRYQ